MGLQAFDVLLVEEVLALGGVGVLDAVGVVLLEDVYKRQVRDSSSTLAFLFFASILTGVRQMTQGTERCV